MYKKIISYLLILSIIHQTNSVVLAADVVKEDIKIDLQDLVMPSEVKDLSKKTGSVYYSTPNKNRPLIPVHFWGSIETPGLHFIPSETSLVNALSLAGGPRPAADLENVSLSRAEKGKIHKYEFNLKSGGDDEAFKFQMRPGDTIFIEQDNFFENRSYYTSLIGIGVSILSGLLLYYQLKKQ
jgi:hypothetical protein